MRRRGRSIGKVPPRRLAPREALQPATRAASALAVILRRSRGQFLELQFQLIDEPLAALGARSEHLALHLGDHQLKVLDQRLGARQLGARLDQRRLQRILVVGKMIGSRDHAQHSSTIALIRAHKSDALSQRVTGQHLQSVDGQASTASGIDSSASRARPPGVLRISPIDSVQHVGELRCGDRNNAAGRQCRPDEPAALQPLGIERHAEAVMPEDLYQRAAAAAEHVEIPSMWLCGVPHNHIYVSGEIMWRRAA